MHPRVKFLPVFLKNGEFNLESWGNITSMSQIFTGLDSL